MHDEDPPEPRTVKRWSVTLDLIEEGDVTKSEAVLDTGDASLTAHSIARRSAHDVAAPAIGDEFAAGRALIDLGHQLLREAEHGAAGREAAEA